MAGLVPAIHVAGCPWKKEVGARIKSAHDEFAPMSAPLYLRPYRAEDEDAAIALWLETWQRAYPGIDFAARVAWWRERWRSELVPKAAIIVAERTNRLVGFVTIDDTGYLDQLVVAPLAEQACDTIERQQVEDAWRLHLPTCSSAARPSTWSRPRSATPRSPRLARTPTPGRPTRAAATRRSDRRTILD